jgi:hypothetical protein
MATVTYVKKHSWLLRVPQLPVYDWQNHHQWIVDCARRRLELRGSRGAQDRSSLRILLEPEPTYDERTGYGRTYHFHLSGCCPQISGISAVIFLVVGISGLCKVRNFVPVSFAADKNAVFLQDIWEMAGFSF